MKGVFIMTKKTEKATRYTYSQFANDVITMANIFIDGEQSELSLDFEKIIDKANKLLEQQARKAEYNANKRAANADKPKELSQGMKINIDLVSQVLSTGKDNAKTASEINTELGTSFYAMQLSNICAHIPKCEKTKVIRETTNQKGLKRQQEYTAYYISE